MTDDSANNLQIKLTHRLTVTRQQEDFTPQIAS